MLETRLRSVKALNTWNNMAAFTIKVAGGEGADSGINCQEFKRKVRTKKQYTKRDFGSNALASRIWLAQQQLKDIGSRQRKYSVL